MVRLSLLSFSSPSDAGGITAVCEHPATALMAEGDFFSPSMAYRFFFRRISAFFFFLGEIRPSPSTPLLSFQAAINIFFCSRDAGLEPVLFFAEGTSTPENDTFLVYWDSALRPKNNLMVGHNPFSGSKTIVLADAGASSFFPPSPSIPGYRLFSLFPEQGA